MCAATTTAKLISWLYNWEIQWWVNPVSQKWHGEIFPSISHWCFLVQAPSEHTLPSGCLSGTSRIIPSHFNFSSLIFSTIISELTSLLSLSCITYKKSIIGAKGWKTMTLKLHVCPSGQEERINSTSITLTENGEGGSCSKRKNQDSVKRK